MNIRVETGIKIQIINSKHIKMNQVKNILVLMIILIFAVSCEKKIDNLEKAIKEGKKL